MEDRKKFNFAAGGYDGYRTHHFHISEYFISEFLHGKAYFRADPVMEITTEGSESSTESTEN
jgi:hypothetical protein